MVIVLIQWKIKPDSVEDFLRFWKEEAFVQDREGLVGEFLSEAHSTAEYSWINWQLTGCEQEYRSFVNVGLWSNPEDFQEQVGKYFAECTSSKGFEFGPRQRVVLKPKCWRVGCAKLPCLDSGGVR